MKKAVFTIAAGEDFLGTLCDAILTGSIGNVAGPPNPLELSRWRVLVPTRRAARALMEAFLARHDEARLLPVIRPIGDVEDDLVDIGTGTPDDEISIVPAISAPHRQFLIARFLKQWAMDHSSSPLAQPIATSTGLTLELAASLGDLIDLFENEDVPMAEIDTLFGGDLPEHRLTVLELLEVVREEFPAKLAALGLMGTVERRNLLLHAEAQRLLQAEPDAPVIAAGSTGSIKATAELLSAVSSLEHGAVVLPGLDQDMDDESWHALEAQHPQFGLKQLLERLEVQRNDVQVLGHHHARERPWLMSEAMRPTQTTHQWHEIIPHQADRVALACSDIQRIVAPDIREEATAIALIMRNALEKPGQTAALITPDRVLARRVKAELKRWNINIDDTAGEPLSRTPAGSLFLNVLEGAVNGFTGSLLMAVLDHPLASLGRTRAETAAIARDLEITTLRGNVHLTACAHLPDLVAARRAEQEAADYKGPVHDDGVWQRVGGVAERIAAVLGPVEVLLQENAFRTLEDLLTCHIRTIEQLAASDEDEALTIWAGEAGEALSTLLRGLIDDAEHCPVMTGQDYAMFMRQQLASTTVRPVHGRHPRLTILGLLEARLIKHDVMILGGLNEGVWPAQAEVDPWLNRPQRLEIALPVPERRIGLSAHDFVQAACQGRVWLTSSNKRDGSPVVHSRWLLRLEALLKAGKKEDVLQPVEPWTGWAIGLDRHVEDLAHPVRQPNPCPDVADRPDRLSVTRIELLARRPYDIYAQYILKLNKLEPLDVSVGARERGIHVHKALQKYFNANPDVFAPDAADQLAQVLLETVAEEVPATELTTYWTPQFIRMADWLIAQERDKFRDTVQRLSEVDADLDIDLGGVCFKLTGKADRIDRLNNGCLRIIDYKTGTPPGLKPGTQGYSPQLDIEAVIATHGGFGHLATGNVNQLNYIKISGGEPAGEIKSSSIEDSRIEETHDNLKRLLAAYLNPSQTYPAIWRKESERREGDFDRLSRWREWGHVYSDDGSEKS